MPVPRSVSSNWLQGALIAALFLIVVTAPGPGALAQDDLRVGAPGELSAETTEDGIVLSWEAPVTTNDQITGYEVSGLHVRRGVGIVKRVGGTTDGNTTSWTDREATDPGLQYVYRVRALRNGEEGRWSAFVITGIDDVAPAPTIAAPEPEPTAALPEPEPTEVVPVAPSEPTAAPPPPEPTSVPVAPPLPEPTRVVPVAPVEPTAAPQQPEPTAVVPLPEVEPTVAGPEPEPTTSA